MADAVETPDSQTLNHVRSALIADASREIRNALNYREGTEDRPEQYEFMLAQIQHVLNAKNCIYVSQAAERIVVSAAKPNQADGSLALWEDPLLFQQLVADAGQCDSTFIIESLKCYLQAKQIQWDKELPYDNVCIAIVTGKRQGNDILLGWGSKNGAPFDDNDRLTLALLAEELSIALRRVAIEDELLANNKSLLADKNDQESLIKQLEEAQDQLLQSEKMASIGQLAAGVAHEINNPVGYVSSNLTSLQRYVNELFRVLDAYQKVDPIIAQNQEAYDEIQRIKEDAEIEYLRDDLVDLLGESAEGVKRVKDIVQDLKDFSHADADDWEWSDLHKGIDSTMNIVWNEIKYKAEVNKEYGTIPSIECIPSQLNQVFMNLMVNAAHAIEDRGLITVRTGCIDEEYIWVEIEDTGKGISDEHLKRIFDPFFTTKPVGKGTGLGLSLSYGIIEKHGGRIEVTSKQGQGTKFRVILPISHPGNEDEDEQCLEQSS